MEVGDGVGETVVVRLGLRVNVCVRVGVVEKVAEWVRVGV